MASWPYMGGVLPSEPIRSDISLGQRNCTGVKVADNKILTAAHCCPDGGILSKGSTVLFL